MMQHGINKLRLITYADNDGCHRKVGPVGRMGSTTFRGEMHGSLPLAPPDLSAVFALLCVLYGLYNRPSWVTLSLG